MTNKNKVIHSRREKEKIKIAERKEAEEKRREKEEYREAHPFWKRVLFVLVLLFLFFIGVFLYSHYIGTTGLIVKEYKVVDSDLPESFYGFKIVHISDLHYGRIIKEAELNHVVSVINNDIKPDIIVFTGDLFDRDHVLDNNQIDALTSGLSKLNASVGKYAVRGNHDYKFDVWESVVSNGGFVNLNDKHDLVYFEGLKPILLYGMSTNLHGDKSINEKLTGLNDYLNTINANPNEYNPSYKIMLLHEPDFIDDISVNFDLVLAGHSHNGQINIPFAKNIALPVGGKKYYGPHYTIGNTELYVSSGLGTSTMDLRLFNRPSINFYRLMNK